MEFFSKKSTIRFRYDIFGGLAWFPHGEIFKLDFEQTALLDLLSYPRCLDHIDTGFFSQSIGDMTKKLVAKGLVSATDTVSAAPTRSDYQRIRSAIQEAQAQKICKPLWAHLQPFKFCNQECMHCYCNGSPSQGRFVLPLDIWKLIIDDLSSFGILEIYITGGETLVVPECLDLIRYIVESGLGTGLSTNGMAFCRGAIDTLIELGIKSIQISLDGATQKTHDYVRGTIGAFPKTIANVRKLSAAGITPVINTVVNRINYTEIEQIVQLGIAHGATEFKFFPQKACGRGRHNPELLLDWITYTKITDECRRLTNLYNIRIDYLEHNHSCGSGFSGLAVNESADVFPCIFGTEDPQQRLGNMQQDIISNLWFNSPNLQNFRMLDNRQPCHRCEIRSSP